MIIIIILLTLCFLSQPGGGVGGAEPPLPPLSLCPSKSAPVSTLLGNPNRDRDMNKLSKEVRA